MFIKLMSDAYKVNEGMKFMNEAVNENDFIRIWYAHVLMTDACNKIINIILNLWKIIKLYGN